MQLLVWEKASVEDWRAPDNCGYNKKTFSPIQIYEKTAFWLPDKFMVLVTLVHIEYKIKSVL